MPIKKSELYSTLWASCNALRGGMDATQYKDYVLTLLFVKYVSDKHKNRTDTEVEIPVGGSFDDLVALKNDKEIGDKINKVIGKLAEANGLKGVIDLTDFNDEKKLGKGSEMIDTLTKLISIFESSFDFSQNRADGDDLLGDAYEYLMRLFATESGKSKGQFYTPSEVSRVMAKLIGVNTSTSKSQTIYDPTCGSGSLLLKVYSESPTGVTIYGQEKDNTTKALAVMNMWLHGYTGADIAQGNTLATPHFKNSDGTLKTFDFVVANPPFSTKNWMSGFDPSNDIYSRFSGYGIPPTKNGDYAFFLHIIRSLKSTGKGAVILPHGVLFRGNAEAEIRTALINRKFIRAIIGLPANLFYGTGIPACIILIDKENAESREGIWMIDASKGYIKDGNKNRLREQDMHKIVDTFTRVIEIAKYSRMVPYSEIESNEYNLNIPRYIDTQEVEDLENIEAHLLGGIPEDDINALESYWGVCPDLRRSLFIAHTRPGFVSLRVADEDIRETIYTHDEFLIFRETVSVAFQKWRSHTSRELRAIDKGSHAKSIILNISESLLDAYKSVALIDEYDIYQHALDYWNETMQDDVYMISGDGWIANEELIPDTLIINRYFATEQSEIVSLESSRDTTMIIIEDLEEEYGGEDGLMADAKNEKDKFTGPSVKARHKAIKGSDDDREEYVLLEKWLELTEEIATLNKEIKAKEKELQIKVKNKYDHLTLNEIQSLIVDDKWIGSIESRIIAELDQVSQTLTSRIQTLAERYERTLGELDTETKSLEKSVEDHLRTMGFSF
ncbi:type I restriction-modification system subunit M [Candidatus Gracilibacteria bacterium]|nr:type I restriction-modification system subunit M [Candidatus Gracilibacteria bacterium]